MGSVFSWFLVNESICTKISLGTLSVYVQYTLATLSLGLGPCYVIKIQLDVQESTPECMS